MSAAPAPAKGKALPAEIDVLIVGAGLSGVNASWRVATKTDKSYAIVEMREDLGGTWSFFQYPGIRSDSDVHTLGLTGAPWHSNDPIAGGKELYEYIKDSAHKFGVYDHIYFKHRVASASWSTADAKWTVDIETPTETKQVRCNFLYHCSGYYDYKNPYQPDIPGLNDFKGQVIHPQFWDKSFSEEGKRIVIIGSGATAVTLLPALTPKAKHVTMLQRSPSYFVAMPRYDPITVFFQTFIPKFISHPFLRNYWAFKYWIFFMLCRTFPGGMRRILMWLTSLHLPKNIPVKPHFDPSYKPWDQRICFVPDGDMFAALRSGKAGIATDTIDTVTADGIKLKSGEFLPADVIITATGLRMQLFGGSELKVDGKPIKISSKFVWKGFMIQDVPNLALSIGYTTISWSLGSDITAQAVVKILKRMERTGKDYVVPTVGEKDNVKPKVLVNLDSGYIKRAESYLPKAGTTGSWYARSNYFYDAFWAAFDPLTDSLAYKKAGEA